MLPLTDNRTEDEKFEALIEYAASMTLKDEPLEDTQPAGEDFRPQVRLRLRKEYLKMQLRRRRHGLPDTSDDGFIAVDIHGNFDVDYPNPGPVLKRETQWINKGYTALKNVDQIAELNRREARLTQALVPSWRDRYSEEGFGYESASSEVSQDHCRNSPYYPACDDSCWLKKLHDTDEQAEKPRSTAVPAENPCIYERLEPNEFRVLVLEAGSGNDEIVCQLRQMKLPNLNDMESSREDYEALSYTWGDSKRTHTISCDRKTFGVTTNLFEALTHLRNSGAKRTIWIDALCINQDDIAERNEQVRHMLNIYQAAVRVVVWLGLPQLHGSFVIAAMNYMKARDNRHAIFRRDHEQACLGQLQKLVDTLDVFFHRPWFTRCWIRQEVSAARFITVQCGHHQTSWNAMKKIANCSWRFQQKLRSQGIEMSEGTDRPKQRSLRYLKRHWILGQPLIAEMGDLRSIWYYHTGSLLELLMISRLFDATDPRDKVYSVLGLAQSPLSQDANDTKGMRIDYGMSISRVYQYTTKYLINKDRSLDVLCLISTHSNQGSGDLPTWTLDWRVPSSRIPLRENWEYFTYKWGAAGFSKCLEQDQNDFGRLVVEGFPVGEVTQLLPLAPTSLPHPPEDPAGNAELFDPSKHVKRFALVDGKPAAVPAAAIEGEIIFVLFGCKMPVALRVVSMTEEEVTAIVVGPCYVPSIMFGEDLKRFQDNKEAKWTRIVVV